MHLSSENSLISYGVTDNACNSQGVETETALTHKIKIRNGFSIDFHLYTKHFQCLNIDYQITEIDHLKYTSGLNLFGLMDR